MCLRHANLPDMFARSFFGQKTGRNLQELFEEVAFDEKAKNGVQKPN